MVAHRDEEVLLVQHLVVLEVVQQGIGHCSRLSRQKNGGAFHPGRGADEDRLQKILEVNGISAQLGVEQTAALLPRHHQGEQGAANHQREPPALEQLEQVGCKERQIHHKEAARGSQAQSQRVAPAVADHKERERGGDQHVQRHGNAVGRRQVAGRAEHHHRQHNGHEQAPVHQRHVDLPGVAHAGVLNVQARQIAELDDLLGDTEGARDQGLRSDHGGKRGQPDQRNQRPVGRHHEKRVLDGLRLGQQERALTEIIERERRHRHTKPRQANGSFAKVAQVGIQGFRTRHAQHDSAQNDEAGAGLVPHEHQRVVRAHRPQNFGVPVDVKHAQHRQGHEPHQRDGPKKLADAACAPLLHRKKAKQHH